MRSGGRLKHSGAGETSPTNRLNSLLSIGSGDEHPTEYLLIQGTGPARVVVKLPTQWLHRLGEESSRLLGIHPDRFEFASREIDPVAQMLRIPLRSDLELSDVRSR